MSTFTCSKCGESKALTEYHKRNSVKRGHDSWCKSCKAIYRQGYFERNKEKETIRGRVKAWKTASIDITMDEYKEACARLNNSCEICGASDQTLHVDHDHTTGKIRGFLCGACNRALGLLKDSHNIISKALIYLKTHEDSSNTRHTM